MKIKPSRKHSQSVPEPIEIWLEYLNKLNFGPGNRDHDGYNAFLRAGSLHIDQQIAMNEVTTRIKKTGGSFNSHKLEEQLRRAYEHAGIAQSKIVTIIQPSAPDFDPEKLKKFAEGAPGISAEGLKKKITRIPQ